MPCMVKVGTTQNREESTERCYSPFHVTLDSFASLNNHTLMLVFGPLFVSLPLSPRCRFFFLSSCLFSSLFLPLHFSTMTYYPLHLGRLTVLLLLWTTIACKAAVIPQLPQQQLSETPVLDHQQPDQQSSQENAAFLNHDSYYNNDPPTITNNLITAEAPSENIVLQNEFAVPPPIVPDTESQQDSLPYNDNQQDDSLMNHAIDKDNDQMLDNPSMSTMDEEDDNELYDDDDEDEDDMLATNDEEGYLFNVPDNNDDIENEELVVDPSTGMPAFRNKNDNDFNVMNQPNAPAPADNDIGIITPPSVDHKSSPATDASTSTTPLHQHSFFGDWRLLLAAVALLAVWKLVTGKPRLMGASTRVTQTCMIL